MRDLHGSSERHSALPRHLLSRGLACAFTLMAACTGDLPTPPLQEADRTAAGTIEQSAAAGTVTLSGAGDIAKCPGQAGATAKLLAAIPGTIFTLGDNVYPDGNAAMFNSCYGSTWGRLRSRTRPSPGNHDYLTAGAASYYSYFGSGAGPRGRGYYSYNLGAWHIVSLNSEVAANAGSAQERWLRQDLATNPKRCTLAYWHKPLFSSGSMGASIGVRGLWQALYDRGVEVVLNGHDHDYERFAPQTPTGSANPTRGIREFVVGTGGAPLLPFKKPVANSRFRYNKAHGVLTLTLRDGSYAWKFIAVSGAVIDAGQSTCH
jgi:3',5'-cyclic AMP phosphodiesterase CpdA